MFLVFALFSVFLPLNLGTKAAATTDSSTIQPRRISIAFRARTDSRGSSNTEQQLTKKSSYCDFMGEFLEMRKMYEFGYEIHAT